MDTRYPSSACPPLAGRRYRPPESRKSVDENGDENGWRLGRRGPGVSVPPGADVETGKKPPTSAATMAMTAVFFLAAMVLLAGCGPAFLPGPTSRAVSSSDLAGTWQYTADFGKTVITLEVKPDGTFQQTVAPAGGTNTLSQAGLWRLDQRNHIRFDAVLTHEGFKAANGWTAEEANWWITDGIGKQPKVVPFGGTHPDPDSWQRFEKIR